MKASTISELKQELTNIPHSQLLEICLRLARFKKENKELLTYLLFEAHDEQATDRARERVDRAGPGRIRAREVQRLEDEHVSLERVTAIFFNELGDRMGRVEHRTCRG